MVQKTEGIKYVSIFLNIGTRISTRLKYGERERLRFNEFVTKNRVCNKETSL